MLLIRSVVARCGGQVVVDYRYVDLVVVLSKPLVTLGAAVHEQLQQPPAAVRVLAALGEPDCAGIQAPASENTIA